MGLPTSPVPDRIRAARVHEGRVERALQRLGLAYGTGAALEGLWFDFLVTGPADPQVAIEAKAYSGPSLANMRNMLRIEAAGKQELAGVPVVYVLPDPDGGKPGPQLEPGFAYLSDLGPAIVRAQRLWALAPGRARVPVPAGQSNSREIFVAMPFDPLYSDVFQVGIRLAARTLKLGAYRVDFGDGWGDIVANIKTHLASAVFVVADLSQSRPNVLFEYGFATALRKPIVAISAEDPRSAPFDVNHDKIIKYELHDTNALRLRLLREFRQLMRDLGQVPAARTRPR